MTSNAEGAGFPAYRTVRTVCGNFSVDAINEVLDTTEATAEQREFLGVFLKEIVTSVLEANKEVEDQERHRQVEFLELHPGRHTEPDEDTEPPFNPRHMLMVSTDSSRLEIRVSPHNPENKEPLQLLVECVASFLVEIGMDDWDQTRREENMAAAQDCCKSVAEEIEPHAEPTEVELWCVLDHMGQKGEESADAGFSFWWTQARQPLKWCAVDTLLPASEDKDTFFEFAMAEKPPMMPMCYSCSFFPPAEMPPAAAEDEDSSDKFPAEYLGTWMPVPGGPHLYNNANWMLKEDTWALDGHLDHSHKAAKYRIDKVDMLTPLPNLNKPNIGWDLVEMKQDGNELHHIIEKGPGPNGGSLDGKLEIFVAYQNKTIKLGKVEQSDLQKDLMAVRGVQFELPRSPQAAFLGLMVFKAMGFAKPNDEVFKTLLDLEQRGAYVGVSFGARGLTRIFIRFYRTQVQELEDLAKRAGVDFDFEKVLKVCDCLQAECAEIIEYAAEPGGLKISMGCAG